jgi:hypothetical protein
MTTNAIGNDEWVGVDNITVTGTPTITAAKSQSWGAVKARYQK